MLGGCDIVCYYAWMNQCNFVIACHKQSIVHVLMIIGSVDELHYASIGVIVLVIDQQGWTSRWPGIPCIPGFPTGPRSPWPGGPIGPIRCRVISSIRSVDKSKHSFIIYLNVSYSKYSLYSEQYSLWNTYGQHKRPSCNIINNNIKVYEYNCQFLSHLKLYMAYT